MSINTTPAPVYEKHYNTILTKFPVQYRDKLRMYTLEELFYVYKLATFELTPDRDGIYKSSDLSCAAMKRRLFSWLKGEYNEYLTLIKPITPSAFAKIGRKFSRQWYKFLAGIEAELLADKHVENVQALKDKFSKAS